MNAAEDKKASAAEDKNASAAADQKASAAIEKLEARILASDSLLGVGLDPEMSRIPERFRSEAYPLFAFCRHVVDQTAEFACAFKPNTAFFEAHGASGWTQLAMLFAYLREGYPAHFTICDAKRADIGSTNWGYVRSVFDELGADSVTLHPYLGREALSPFLDRADKASILLCRTSNPGAGELQDLVLEGKPLWQQVAERVSGAWNSNRNCMLVVGATYPEEMGRIRSIAPGMNFLVPGIGAQGGDIAATVRAGLRHDGRGLVLSSSRAIVYSNDPQAIARETRDAINDAREAVLAHR